MKKILFIDDDMRRMQWRIKYLELEGYEIVKAETVGEALEKAKLLKSEIGLVILDIMMPGNGIFKKEETQGYTRTGRLILNRIKEILPSIPIIILTIVEDEEFEEEMGLLGVTEYFRKIGTDVNDFYDAVKRNLSLKKYK